MLCTVSFVTKAFEGNLLRKNHIKGLVSIKKYMDTRDAPFSNACVAGSTVQFQHPLHSTPLTDCSGN